MPGSRYLVSLTVMVLAVTFGLAVPAGAVATSLFYASNDSYVNLASPNTNYDTTKVLAVAAGPTRMSYVSFVVTGMTEPVTHARLRLHTRDVGHAGSPTGGTVEQVANNWVETTLRAANRPAPIGTPLSMFGAVRPDGWYEADVTPAITGNLIVSFRISSTDPDGAYYDSRENFPNGPQLIVDTGPPVSNQNVLLAAGDIAVCGRDQDEQTARILDREPGTVAAVGDTVYETGTAAEYANCYGPTWGRHKSRTRPAVGNHEYLTPNAAGYFGYFGAAAGAPDKGYYSYDLAGGRWHIVVLNSNCSRVGGCHVGSPQERWLRADLAANPARCTLAYWHHPVFSSGERQRPEVLPLFQALYDDRAEIVISGHAHQYERFAPQTPTRAADPIRGIRQFVVGTGGRSLQADFGTVVPNSEVRNGTTHGVLWVNLLADGYQWRFLPIQGQTFSDFGTDTCR
ncbi:DNRLRE domain-containing protein [Micromonospora sp. WMMD882]|uniref:CBM96 family carbohydrate-binding protein n=1 Tax=Micromonospora sp. WMMD882 TaxID=3015151 RepID=UPI00248C1334|nr:DNRLRE domain-containing protein [Micromonospora sp. WMMD882]WBB78948.1 DNRLRE domain-containing protein [Micromonospora sp. WMMD882]